MKKKWQGHEIFDFSADLHDERFQGRYPRERIDNKAKNGHSMYET